jgi:hypothetical protein
MMKNIGMGIGTVVAFLAFIWIMQGNDFFLFRVFAPRYEQVRRQTFEQSKAYQQGAIQELENMQFEYVKANADQKQALASVILHRAADFDARQLPPDLYAFISGLRREGSAVR